jgi:hypothetical protein
MPKPRLVHSSGFLDLGAGADLEGAAYPAPFQVRDGGCPHNTDTGGRFHMDDGIYIPLSDRTLRKLDQLERWFAVSGEGYSEDRIIGMALDNMLACIRQGENDNDPDNFPAAALPPEALSLSSCSSEGEPAGL